MAASSTAAYWTPFASQHELSPATLQSQDAFHAPDRDKSSFQLNEFNMHCRCNKWECSKVELGKIIHLNNSRKFVFKPHSWYFYSANWSRISLLVITAGLRSLEGEWNTKMLIFLLLSCHQNSIPIRLLQTWNG